MLQKLTKYFTLFKLIFPLLLILILKIPDLDAQDNDYRIGVEDILHISVWGNEQLTGEVKVRPDGKISFPLINDLLVDGLTCLEITEIIKKKLASFIKNPEPTVILASLNKNKVYIMGGVQTDGVYNLQRKTSILQLIIMAGGFTSSEAIDLENAYILRGNNYLLVNLKKLIEDKNCYFNIELLPNDIVYIPDNNKYVTVIGEVKSPGNVIFQNGITVMDAILKSGGPNEDADLNDTKIIRKNLDRRGNSEVKIKVLLKNIMKKGDLKYNVKLKPKDIIIVPTNFF